MLAEWSKCDSFICGWSWQLPFMVWSFISCRNVSSALDADEKGKQDSTGIMMIFIQALNTQSLPPLNYPEPVYFCRVLCVYGAWVGSGCPTGHCECCPSELYVRRAWGKPELLQARDGPPVSVPPALRIERCRGSELVEWMKEFMKSWLWVSVQVSNVDLICFICGVGMLICDSVLSQATFGSLRRINWPEDTF